MKRGLVVRVVLFVFVVLLASCAQAEKRRLKPDVNSHPITTIPSEVKSQLPEPTVGFKWHMYKSVIFQMPIDWNEKEQVDMTNGFPISIYAASPEEFSGSKMFEMGGTVRAISGSNKIKSIPAKKIGMFFLKPFLEAHQNEDVLMFSQKNDGDFENTLFRFRDAPKGLTPIIVHKYVMANDVTDSAYIFTFESPEKDWEHNWEKYGAPFLGRLIFTSTE